MTGFGFRAMVAFPIGNFALAHEEPVAGPITMVAFEPEVAECAAPDSRCRGRLSKIWAAELRRYSTSTGAPTGTRL